MEIERKGQNNLVERFIRIFFIAFVFDYFPLYINKDYYAIALS